MEGEDDDCNNETFAPLTKDFRLDLEFQIGQNGVTAISSSATAEATATTNTGSVTLDGQGKIANGEKAASYQWYNAADNTALTDDANNDGVTTQTYTNNDTTNAISVYCIVTTESGSKYRTNTIDVAKKTA